MKFRKAIFVVTYSKTKKEIEYLILKRKLHWKGWEFPKGGIKNQESVKKALVREIKEETGQKPLKIKKFKVKGKYKYNKYFADRPGIQGQSYILYAAEIRKKIIKIDKLEHSSYKWAGFKEALKKLTWQNQKKSLRIVDSYLKNERKFIKK